MSRALGFKLRAAHIQQQSIMGLLLKAGLKQNIPHPAPKMKEQQKIRHTLTHTGTEMLRGTWRFMGGCR